MTVEKLEELLNDNKLTNIKKNLKDMNEFDIADLIENLHIRQLVKVFRLLPKDKATDVFVNMNEDVQRHVITSLTNQEATEIIEDMFSDDAADLFEEMPAVM